MVNREAYARLSLPDGCARTSGEFQRGNKGTYSPVAVYVPLLLCTCYILGQGKG